LVVGVGPNNLIGQNGIQISNGARGGIVNNDVSQNIFLPQTFVAAGILLFNAAPTTVVANTATQNDVGILVSGTKGATLFNNDLSDSTFDGIELRDGTTYTVVSSNHSHENQLDGSYIKATATSNTITRDVLMQNGNLDAEDLSTGQGTAGMANMWSKNGIFNIVCGGYSWRMMPKDLPPRAPATTPSARGATRASGRRCKGRNLGVWQKINDALRTRVRHRDKRKKSPSRAIIDSQSVKTTEQGGPRSKDAHKMVSGRKRYLIVDTLGLILAVVVHSADIQDRDGANRLSKDYERQPESRRP
jgi:parallel beta-helix repeat protein